MYSRKIVQSGHAKGHAGPGCTAKGQHLAGRRNKLSKERTRADNSGIHIAMHLSLTLSFRFLLVPFRSTFDQSVCRILPLATKPHHVSSFRTVMNYDTSVVNPSTSNVRTRGYRSSSKSCWLLVVGSYNEPNGDTFCHDLTVHSHARSNYGALLMVESKRLHSD